MSLLTIMVLLIFSFFPTCIAFMADRLPKSALLSAQQSTSTSILLEPEFPTKISGSYSTDGGRCLPHLSISFALFPNLPFGHLEGAKVELMDVVQCHQTLATRLNRTKSPFLYRALLSHSISIGFDIETMISIRRLQSAFLGFRTGPHA